MMLQDYFDGEQAGAGANHRENEIQRNNICYISYHFNKKIRQWILPYPTMDFRLPDNGFSLTRQ